MTRILADLRHWMRDRRSTPWTRFSAPTGRRLYQDHPAGQPQLLAIDRGRRCLTGVGLPRFDLGQIAAGSPAG